MASRREGRAGRRPADERAGILFLVAILAAAFFPAVLTEFDSAALLKAVASAMAQARLPERIAPAGEGQPATIPETIVCPTLLAESPTATSPTTEASPDPLDVLSPSDPPCPQGPPGLLPSPRAPPRAA